jgi:ABC-type sugar transport system substrate-binding protein
MRPSTAHFRPAARVALGLQLLCFAAVTGCERADEPPPTQKLPPAGSKIIIIGPSAYDPTWPVIQGGVRRYLRSVSFVEAQFLAPVDDQAETLKRLVSNAVAREPVAICLYVRNAESARATLGMIAQKSIVLVTMGRRLDDPRIFGQVLVNEPGGAALLAENLKRVAAGGRSYLLLHQRERDAAGARVYDRFMAAARDQHSMNLLEARAASGPPRAQRAQIAEMLDKFRHASLVITLDPAPWLSGDPPGLTLGNQNRFCTLSTAPTLWPRLRSGEAAALAGPLHGEIGYKAVELAVEGLTQSRGSGVQRLVDCELVTPDTLEHFIIRYAEASGMDPAELLPKRSASQPSSRPGGG